MTIIEVAQSIEIVFIIKYLTMCKGFRAKPINLFSYNLLFGSNNVRFQLISPFLFLMRPDE